MPLASTLGGQLRTLFLATAFEEPLTEQEIENSNFTEVEGGLVKDIKDLNLGADADTLPLCEDLGPESVGAGDSCWSTCQGQCINDVLKRGLQFDFDEIADGHAGCASHFECVGNEDRQLCHAVRSLDLFEMPQPVLAWSCVEAPTRLCQAASVPDSSGQLQPEQQDAAADVSTRVAGAATTTTTTTAATQATAPARGGAKACCGRGRSSDFL